MKKAKARGKKSKKKTGKKTSSKTVRKQGKRTAKKTTKKKTIKKKTAAKPRKAAKTGKSSGKKKAEKSQVRKKATPRSGKAVTISSSGSRRKAAQRAPVKPTPQENLSRPFNIIESYMGTYSFDDIYAVLFVCTGNMCRSPLAEGILKKKVMDEAPESLRDKFFIQSSGIYAYEGNKPSESAVKTALQNMIDISSIRSKPINRVFIEQSDLILALSIDHLNFINENFPTARGKTFLLKNFAQTRPIQMSDSIPDPMGFSIEFYVKTFAEIKNAIDAVFPAIVRAAETKLGTTSSKA